MKKKWIVMGTIAGVILLGGTTVFAIKKSNEETVKVISMQEMMGYGGGMNSLSLSGNITSDVSQDVYLGSSQVVQKIFVQEGDTVKEGDPLVAYDMTLVNLELEMKKLDRQGVELNIKKAQQEIRKLKNAKPASEDPGTGGGMDGEFGDWGDPGIGEEPLEPEEPIQPEDPIAAEAELTDASSYYMGEGTEEDPYHFLCSKNGVIHGSFLNRMAREQCFFVIEAREGDVSNGALLKIWGQKITDSQLQIDPDAKYLLDLGKLEEEEQILITEAVSQLDRDTVTGKKWCKGQGTAEKPYVFLVTSDGTVSGSFFNQLKAQGTDNYFRIEVREGDNYSGHLIKAWEQKAGNLADCTDSDIFKVDLGSAAEGTPAPDGDVQKKLEERIKELEEDISKLNEKLKGFEDAEAAFESDKAELEKQKAEYEAEKSELEEQKRQFEKEKQEWEDSHGGTTTIPSAPTSPDPQPDPQTMPTSYSRGIAAPMSYVRTIPVDTKDTDTNDKSGTSGKSLGSMMGSVSDGAMTKEEIQKSIKEKEKEIRGYQLDLKDADLELNRIQKELKNQTINSTLNGVVKTVGDPEKGSADGKPLIQVTSSEGLYIKGTVDERQLDDLTVGQQLNGFAYETGVSFTAEVKDISPYPIDGQSGNNSSQYPFTAYIQNAEGLKNYSWAELTVSEDGESFNSGLTLEKAFVRTEDGEYYVMIDDGNGRLKKQTIQIARVVYGSSYEISGGLTAADKIAFPYGKNVKEGAKTEDGTLQDLYQ